MPTRRQERINHDLVRRVSDALRELDDPRIGFLTVTKADVSPDLRHAKIYVSIFEEEEKREACLHALMHSARRIRQAVARNWTVKSVPHLDIILDRDIETADRISRLIARARASDPHPDARSETLSNADAEDVSSSPEDEDAPDRNLDDEV